MELLDLGGDFGRVHGYRAVGESDRGDCPGKSSWWMGRNTEVFESWPEIVVVEPVRFVGEFLVGEDWTDLPDVKGPAFLGVLGCEVEELEFLMVGCCCCCCHCWGDVVFSGWNRVSESLEVDDDGVMIEEGLVQKILVC